MTSFNLFDGKIEFFGLIVLSGQKGINFLKLD